MKYHKILVCSALVAATLPLVNGQAATPPVARELPSAQPLPLSGREPTGAVITIETPQTGAGANSVNTLNPSIQIQGAYQGSTPVGTAAAEPLALTLEDAIKRGIQYNLGSIGASQAVRQARAQRLLAGAQLLPDVAGGLRETVQQIDLATIGLHPNIPIPGFSFPTIVGPFNYFDLRASFTQSFSMTGLRSWRSSQENTRSSELSFKDARQVVTLAVAGSYLQLLASAARIDTARAQIETAQTVYRQAVDRNLSGLNARIDVNRSLVELQTEQQRLTSILNDFEKQKLALARLIGLPMAQRFTLSDTIPYRELPAPNLDDLIQRAFSGRADVQAAATQVKAAELAKKAATSEYYPSLDVAADYGVTGVNPSQSHGTFLATAAVNFPIFRSGRIRASIEQADAALAQRRAEYEDIKAQAEQDVRNAALDAEAASAQVRVAESNRKLAADTLTQARDRFRAGVADTVELVQAQESVATAEQDYINAVFAFNLAQVSLARAMGQTEQGIALLLQGK
ncbi:MAG: TolC family protein [Bryobacterales bacterium]|nr:TolC family protein [Bryobacterales bacterium]MBV9397608.1 TolC family protein [Bryobacterales bacterium]